MLPPEFDHRIKLLVGRWRQRPVEPLAVVDGQRGSISRAPRLDDVLV